MEKNIDEYPKDKRKKDGCSYICKICTKKYKSEYYLTNKDIISKKHKNYVNHYTNLQPLCSKVNRYIKRNNII